MDGNPVLPRTMPTDLKALPLRLDGTPTDHPRGITALTVAMPTSTRAARSNAARRPPARWRTPEFIFYGIAYLFVVPWMLWVPYTLSSTSHPNYVNYVARLSPGWLFGRPVDNSDAQYRSFRSNIPALALLSFAHLTSGIIYTYFVANGDPTRRIPFHVVFSLFTIFALHGASALKVLVILGLNYAIAKASTRLGIKGATLGWGFNIAILFLNERYQGYKFGSLGAAFQILDSIHGAYPRWHVSFNITMLRLISFDMDYYWAKQPGASGLPSEEVLNDRQRTTISHEDHYYNVWNYLAYTLYTPLYIAGPIMTFNDFIWQSRRPVSLTVATKGSYTLRFLFCFLTMEFILHFMYMVAIKDANAWKGDTPFELSMVGFWNLIIVWLKLLIPWRFFRLWALLDGVDPPENMVRCMANNYSTLGFWRSWHRSYNLWLLRYIYVPIGGSRSRAIGTILVFTFVALWHDLSFKLLAWGWLVSLFVLPEIIGRQVFPQNKFGEQWWYRHLCALGAVFNILMMMIANLVGFVIGLDGIRYMLDQLLGSANGFRFMLLACACLFIATQTMFEYREEEMRRGIYRKC